MREILFRGKLKNTGEWAFGNLNVTIKGINIITPDDTPIGKYGEVIPETVGQYTGLTDKNGKKIFEGDILHIKTGNGWSCPKGTDIYYEVVFTEFNEECATWAEYIGYMAKRGEDNLSSIHYVVNSYGAEVIGNIHDNPELLKGGAE